MKFDDGILVIGPNRGPNLLLSTHYDWRWMVKRDAGGWDVVVLWLSVGWWRGESA